MNLTRLILEDNNDDDILRQLTEPQNKMSNSHKKAFLNSVKKLNQYNSSIYRKFNLNEIANKLKVLGDLAEQVTLSETDDWFDAITLKRDMKQLKESAQIFYNSAKEIQNLQTRLESSYEDFMLKLNRYFEIENTNNNTLHN